MRLFIVLVTMLLLVGCDQEKKVVEIKIPVLPVMQTNIGGALDKPIFSCNTLNELRVIVFHNKEANIFSAIYGDILTPEYSIQQFGDVVQTSARDLPGEGSIDRRIILEDDVTSVNIALVVRGDYREGYVRFRSEEKGVVETTCHNDTIQSALDDEEIYSTMIQVDVGS